ncbi:transcriptional regulator [Frankia sp. EI5c]|uniref:TetR/AcrR family transcriptional regulator n=1 Tax=Frankia sp. EI5c TaxID=683316 RepID=UPI0007C2F497|nr:TetR/AcrR family transcriptional regulator [Frankia sp. EI5c]OAA21106.1 transcriptional regulator [Frankia sp. EI5c]
MHSSTAVDLVEAPAERSTRSRRTRSDFLASRRDLLDAVGRLLARNGRRFSLVDLAAEAGVSTATAYRHFVDVHDALDVYYLQLIDVLVTDIRALAAGDDNLANFEVVCDVWVRSVARWGRAAVHVRSAQGYLARLKAQDDLVARLHEVLAPVVLGLVESGVLPPQEPEYAVLLWASVFDERVIVDLLDTLGWSVEQVAQKLTASALRMLGFTGWTPLRAAFPPVAGSAFTQAASPFSTGPTGPAGPAAAGIRPAPGAVPAPGTLPPAPRVGRQPRSTGAASAAIHAASAAIHGRGGLPAMSSDPRIRHRPAGGPARRSH